MNFQNQSRLKIDEVLKSLKTSLSGLTEAEVKRRRLTFGLNSLSSKEVKWWKIFLRQFKSAFIYLLIISGGFFLLMKEYVDAIMILLFVAINSSLGFYQEYRSEQSLKLLKKYLVAKTKVKREGKIKIINTTDLVPGDIVILAAGDIIPADVRFIETINVQVDESILTGESQPVNKDHQASFQTSKDIYKANNLGFSGTTMVSGSATAVVYATGVKTEFGQIADLSVETERVSSFEQNILRLSRFILRLIVVTLILVFAINLLIKGKSADILELLIFSFALAVSVIPEALPLVTTFSLTRGSLHLAKNRVVVKRLSAIEDLGGLEILCTDKTGTLTENKMRVVEIFSDAKDQTLFNACLAFSDVKSRKINSINAFDQALWRKLKTGERRLLDSYQRLAELAFDPQRKRNSVVVEIKGEKILIVRGAPEVLIKLSRNLTVGKKRQLAVWIKSQGERGRRVLAVATKKINVFDKENLIFEEQNLDFNGLIAFVDPIKKTAKTTIKQAKKLGVEIKILTGDSREVAGAVAKSVGVIEDPNQVILGEEFDRMSSLEKLQAVIDYKVFARVSPQQKFEIIEILQTKKQVGFLGEGINDAPALKLASVGLVVEGASDVAREAADIILLSKGLDVIINGIREGRIVFANTVKYIKATLGSNFGNFFAIAAATLLIDFLPLLPLQILLLNLLSDFPMIAIAADKVDDEELKKPKTYNIKEIALSSTIFGFISSIFDFSCFALFFRFGPEVLQTNWFIESLLTELVFLFAIRSWLPIWRAKAAAPILLWLTLIAAIATIVIPYLPIIGSIFKFIKPQIIHLIYIFGLVITYFIITEIIKHFYYCSANNGHKKLVVISK